MSSRKFLDNNGLLYYNQKIQAQFTTKLDKNQGIENGGKFLSVNATTGLVEPTTLDLSHKQDSLTTAQLEVVNANPFTTNEKNKLTGIEAGAEVNRINSISVNGTEIIPDIDLNVDIEMPTHLTDLDSTGFDYVESISAGSTNVTIGGTPKNPTIAVAALEMPDEFTSTETPTGGIGTVLTDMDATVLTPIMPSATLSLGDIVIFANNVQAIVTAINGNEYDAVISRIPADVSFAGITGNPMDNTLLAAEFNSKQDSLTQTQMDAVNSGITSTKVTKIDGIESGAEVNIVEGVSLNGTLGTITNKVAELVIDAVSSSDLETALEDKLDANLGIENAELYLQINANRDVAFSEILSITNEEIDEIMEM